jgi:pyridoxal 5'-phosphate synthase pdxS subunit
METGDGVVAVDGNGVLSENSKKATYAVKVGLAQMLRGGLIMDVVNVDGASSDCRGGWSCSSDGTGVLADIQAEGGGKDE